MNHSIRPAQWLALVATCLCAHAPQLFADECPELIGVLPVAYGTELLTASGDYAYFVVGPSPGLVMIADVSNPSEPQPVGQIEISDLSINQIAVQGGYAYTAGQSSSGASLRVIDVSDPTAPAEVGRFDDPDLSAATAVAVSGAHAYVGVGSSLRVLDVSDPTTPVEVGSLETSWVLDVAVSGRYAYVSGATAMQSYLYVIDVSVPSEPVELSSILYAIALGIAVEGNYLYAATNGGLRVIDVSEPSAPVEVVFVALPYESASDVAVSSGYAYVANGSAGLRVIDVREPTAPVEVGFFDTEESEARSVSVSDGYVYLADLHDGLMIFRECGVFLDGFESGDASAWSAMVP